MAYQPKWRGRDRLEATLSWLAKRSDNERVFMTIYAASAREEADAPDRRSASGLSLGPLDGLIVSIKDIFDIAGEPTLAGSTLRRNAPPATQDAEIVTRLRHAGAIIIGKTACNEFCFTSDGVNPHYGAPGNAADDSRIPGGSSSGAGVSAAEGTCDIAIGSDTGGSVRIPAALNGVVGFKPTAARIPLAGAFPLSPTLDSIGPLAKSVQLCADADAIMAGEEASPLPDVSMSGLRFALPPPLILEHMDDAIGEAFDHALGALHDAGATLLSLPMDDLLEQMEELTAPASIASIEAAQIHADWLRKGGANVDPRTVNTLLKRLDFPDDAYRALLAERAELIAALDRRLAGVDAILGPTLPIFAPPIDRVVNEPDFADIVEYLLLRNTQIVNQFDLTAVSLPLHGLPLPAGLSLIGRRGSDRHVLALAASVERMLAAGA